MLTEKDLVIGKRIRFIWKEAKHDRLNKIAVIKSVGKSFGPWYSSPTIHIDWEDGFNKYNYDYWLVRDMDGNYCFEPVTEETTDTKACRKCGCCNKLDKTACWFCKKEIKNV